jgi:hypothetical protein
VGGIDELRSALVTARASDRTVVIHVATDRHAGVPNYETWWDVPVAAVSESSSVQQARREYEQQRLDQRDYLRPAGAESVGSAEVGSVGSPGVGSVEVGSVGSPGVGSVGSPGSVGVEAEGVDEEPGCAEEPATVGKDSAPLGFLPPVATTRSRDA